jgi:hypothetical protein
VKPIITVLEDVSGHCDVDEVNAMPAEFGPTWKEKEFPNWVTTLTE